VVFPLEYWITQHSKIKLASSTKYAKKTGHLKNRLYTKSGKSHLFFQRQTASGHWVQRREKRGGVSQ